MPTIPIRWADNTDQLRANLRQGLDQIEATKAAADRMTQSLGGGKLMAAAHNFAAAVQQIGGVEKLTNAERERGNALLDKAIEKYRVLGQTAPKSLRDLAAATKQSTTQAFQLSDALANIGLSLGAGAGAALGSGLVLGVRHALELSDALSKLSDRTGITATGLQRLDAIAQPSGNTLEQIASGINRFQRNIVEGGKDTENALARIGLSIRELESLEPDQQFIEIAKAIQTIKDPAEQAFVAMQLFGKAGAELLPSLKAKVDELADSTLKMSDKAVKAWDDFGDAVQRWKTNTLNAIGEVLSELNRPGTSPLTALLLGAQEGAANVLIPRPKAPPAPLSGERGNIPLFAVPGLPPPEVIASIEKFSKALLRAAEAQLAAKGLADQWARIAQFEDLWGKLAAQPRQTFTPFSESLKDFATFEIELGNIDNLVTQTFDEMIEKAKELEAAFRKAFGVTADLSLSLPPGVAPGNREAIDNARAGVDLKPVQDKLGALSAAISDFGASVGGVVGEFAAGTARMFDSINNLKSGIDRFGASSFTAFTLAIQVGVAIGQLIGRFKDQIIEAFKAIGEGIAAVFRFLWDAITAPFRAVGRFFKWLIPGIATGGVIAPGGVQRFAAGGLAQPSIAHYARGTDTVPAMLTPGEMVLNAQQQARLFQIADGRASIDSGVSGSHSVVHVHMDNRGSFFGANAGREIAKIATDAIIERVAQNKSGPNRGAAGAGTGLRAALGMRV